MDGIENGESTRAQIARLEADKESLILQVSVLTDQVEAQGEKIRELEFNIEEQNIKTEDMELQLEEVFQEKLYSTACLRLNIRKDKITTWH